MAILDGKALETEACECYQVLQQELERANQGAGFPADTGRSKLP